MKQKEIKKPNFCPSCGKPFNEKDFRFIEKRNAFMTKCKKCSQDEQNINRRRTNAYNKELLGLLSVSKQSLKELNTLIKDREIIKILNLKTFENDFKVIKNARTVYNYLNNNRDIK